MARPAIVIALPSDEQSAVVAELRDAGFETMTVQAPTELESILVNRRDMPHAQHGPQDLALRKGAVERHVLDDGRSKEVTGAVAAGGPMAVDDGARAASDAVFDQIANAIANKANSLLKFAVQQRAQRPPRATNQLR